MEREEETVLDTEQTTGGENRLWQKPHYPMGLQGMSARGRWDRQSDPADMYCAPAVCQERRCASVQAGGGKAHHRGALAWRERWDFSPRRRNADVLRGDWERSEET
ncbi:uncharacterized protein AAEQ78_002885 isoform 2-T4 [Lycaon pictus]